MKVIVFLIKSIVLLVLSIIFIVFLNGVLLYYSVTNNFGNVEFYDRVIVSDVTEELHEKFLDYILESAQKNSKSEFDEQEIKIMENSLEKVFTLDWFRKNIKLYFYDFQEYFVYGNLLVANVNLRDEKQEIEKNISELVVDKFSDSSTSKQYEIRDNIIESLAIPNRLTSEDIIEDHLPYNWQVQLEKIPSYQRTIMLGIYIGFGVFGLLFIFISGTAGALRLFGLNMLVAGGLSFGAIYYYGEEFLLNNIEKIGFSNNSSLTLVSIISQNSLLMPIIYLVVGLLLIIFGQKIYKLEKQIEQEEKENVENKEIESTEQEEKENVEKKEIESTEQGEESENVEIDKEKNNDVEKKD